MTKLIEKYEAPTTSVALINELRTDGIKLLRYNNKYSDIPSDIIDRTMTLCDELAYCKSVTYDIVDPATGERAVLKIWGCGFAEVIE